MKCLRYSTFSRVADGDTHWKPHLLLAEIDIAGLFNWRWVGHVKLHDDLRPMVIFGS